MGTDIHAFVEFSYERASWFSLSDGTLNLGRDYSLFNAFAFGDGGITDDLLYPPRGLPEKPSLCANRYFFQPTETVIAHFEEVDRLCGDEPNFDPEQYARNRGALAVENFRHFNLLPRPELYSHSWLNLKELKEVFTHAGLVETTFPIEFRAIFSAMEMLAEKFGTENVRLVFAFDG